MLLEIKSVLLLFLKKDFIWIFFLFYSVIRGNGGGCCSNLFFLL